MQWPYGVAWICPAAHRCVSKTGRVVALASPKAVPLLRPPSGCRPVSWPACLPALLTMGRCCGLLVRLPGLLQPPTLLLLLLSVPVLSRFFSVCALIRSCSRGSCRSAVGTRMLRARGAMGL